MNPEALTPWKAENVWQLYIGTSNYLSHSVDERLHVEANDQSWLSSALGAHAGKKLKPYLEGLPKRYPRAYSPEEIFRHFEMSGRLGRIPFQLDLMTAGAIGTNSPWSLRIARSCLPCGRSAGCLGHEYRESQRFLQSGGNSRRYFLLHRRFRTLELNLRSGNDSSATSSVSCWARLISTACCAIAFVPKNPALPRSKYNPRSISMTLVLQRSTLVQVIAQDRPGLLHQIEFAGPPKMQHRDCADRYRGSDGHRRFLPHIQWRQARPGRSNPRQESSSGCSSSRLMFN